MKVLFNIVKRPCLTEKSNYLQETQKKVTFRVDNHANKIEIKNAIENLFAVKVGKIAIANMKGKKKRSGKAAFGKTCNWKKAYVTLSQGNINFIDEL